MLNMAEQKGKPCSTFMVIQVPAWRPGSWPIRRRKRVFVSLALTDLGWDFPVSRQIAELYRVLATMSPSPVIEVNRAVAVAMAERPLAGLQLLDPLWDSMSDYYPFHLCPNSLERAYLRRRLDEMLG